MLNHKLNLSIFSFKIKRRQSSNGDELQIDDFLSSTYPGPDPFSTFSERILATLSTPYTNRNGTLGAIQAGWHNIDVSRRILDITLDGGITGIKQSLIGSGSKPSRQTIDTRDIVALRYFVRIWMPSLTSSGYIFLQSYTSYTIKPLIQDVLLSVLRQKGHTLIGDRINRTTTKQRMEEFFAKGVPIALSIINKPSEYDISVPSPTSAIITLKGGNLPTTANLTEDSIKDLARERFGITLSEEDYSYQYKVKYQITNDRGEKEQKECLLEAQDGAQLIPNIIIPEDYIDSDNYPITSRMQQLCDDEINQINSEHQEG
ncbi:hypothetical protein [uncultured Porphyromonas sp.]|uniref:hypothetical protein n=1 Tax=uncultured Porphyromonas sp. TaxID=159274 RepID=UPI00260EC45D|nr:hypothetical protein [uncultured Porphyromonas sp.]